MGRYPDPNVYESERWTKEGPSRLFPKWREKHVYAITNRGTYSRLTFYDEKGKEHRYKWSSVTLTAEQLEKLGFTRTKRRKPKRLNLNLK
jgi:hypothetical protein